MMLAVDVVLIPPIEIQEKIIKINSDLVRTAGDRIRLDIKNCVPHISIAMGCIGEEDIEIIKRNLKYIADKYNPFKIKCSAAKEKRAHIVIEKSDELRLLHEEVMKSFAPYFSYEISSDMLLSERGETINELTFDYIKNFQKKSSYDLFYPHITVGKSNMRIKVEPFDFICTELSIYQLGNLCTAKKVLLNYILTGDEKNPIN